MGVHLTQSEQRNGYCSWIRLHLRVTKLKLHKQPGSLPFLRRGDEQRSLREKPPGWGFPVHFGGLVGLGWYSVSGATVPF